MFQNCTFTQKGVFYQKFLIIQRKLIKANESIPKYFFSFEIF